MVRKLANSIDSFVSDEQNKPEKELMTELSHRFARARKAKGISQLEMCRRLGPTIYPSWVSAFENGRMSNPTIRTLIRIANAMGYKLELTLTSREELRF